MNRILEAVRAYFNAIENPTEQERHIQMLLAEGFFPITSICRDDLKARGFDADKTTDEQMQELARRMANDYCEQLFWDSMEIIAELIGIPKRRVDFCPKCESELIYFDVTTGKTDALTAVRSGTTTPTHWWSSPMTAPISSRKILAILYSTERITVQGLCLSMSICFNSAEHLTERSATVLSSGLLRNSLSVTRSVCSSTMTRVLNSLAPLHIGFL